MNTIKNTTSSHQALINSTKDQRPVTMQKNVAPFLNKVYNMVNDPSSDELIRWSTDGKSFFVLRHEDFARSVLPRFFKHSNFSSFVRQLNMYGFHKVPHLQHGVLHSDSDSEQWEFSNPHFQRNQPDLLLLVTRKKGRENDESGTTTTTNTNIDLQRILEEIQVIKQHQMNISSQLKSIQDDNSILWQETISARERHQRHQETIDKILRFLASVFSNEKSNAISRKRRYLLEAAPDKNDQGSSERPVKVQKTKTTPEFKLDDYDLQGVAEHTTSTNPTSELADAIALNDKSKQSTSSPSWIYPIPQDLSQVMNTQQIQGLQGLIGLAQSHPALLSQLTTDVLNTYQQGNSTNDLAAGNLVFDPNSTPNNNNNNNAIVTIPSTTQHDPSLIQPLTSNNNSIEAPTKPSLPQISNKIQTLARSADDITSDIDILGSNIQALAQQLGFDPTKSDDDLLGYVDMDKFLQAYGPGDDSSFQYLDDIYPSETISPVTTNPASPNTDNGNL
ncbi:hypothetical protein BC941DRAFT_494379 [Chlamydoabsidia padenii]|nr:hypothetical protein BC941DRAFT_494379 [Chlamydoabsidia padenii]